MVGFSLRRRWLPAARVTSLAVAGALLSLLAPALARAETVIERAARTGVITLGGATTMAPYSFLNAEQQPVGYGIAVAERIAAEVSGYLGKPVTVVFEPVDDPASLFRQVRNGEIDLACGAQFTWEREMFVDYTLPFSLSGIRILTRQNRPSLGAAGFAGQRVGVVEGSLGDRALVAWQPKATRVPLSGLQDGVEQLIAGQLDAVAGDSVILAGAIQRKGAEGFGLVPEAPLARYAVGCLLPENNSTFRNLANLAVAKLIQGYVNDNPADLALVDPWLGPKGMLNLPAPLIKDYFLTMLLNHEQILVTAPDPSASSEPTP